MLSPNTDKSLSECLEYCFSNFSKVLNCIKIGEIVSFDKTSQTATIKILHKKINEFNLLKRELVDYPLLQEVPCVIMGGGGSYTSYPISAGDQCVLLFNDFQLDNWQATGQSNPSLTSRKHDISDAIAIVGLRALPNALQNFSDYLNLHYSDNSSIVIGNTIEVNNQNINLNGNVKVTTAPSGSFVTKDDKTVTVVNGIITSIA